MILNNGISLCRRLALAALIVLLSSAETPSSAAAPAAGAEVDFNRHIKPIFSDRCFACHGPDDQARQSGLRLDSREGLFKLADSGLAVVGPGRPEESELFQRITAVETSERMPPADSNLELNQDEIDLIRRWIEGGAPWEEHWSFKALAPVRVPAVRDPAWPQNEIDRFVLARLEEEQLQPSPPAENERWLRRVTFDLTGLPPTLDELDRFLADHQPDARERVVDRLLASPSFGERKAVDWMDVARYADTHGYQADRYRSTWPWRDWVIRAFNANLPYDRFLAWQLAGDLFPQASRDQRLATAFNRHHMQTEEGGTVEEEFRVAYVKDRVDTMGTAFLGLSLQCASCHDHKYDPIAQKEYYSLFAFFNNIDESGQTSHFTDAVPVPTLLLPDEATEQRLQDVESKIRAQEAKVPALREAARRRFHEWLNGPRHVTEETDPSGSFPFDQITDGKVANDADPDKPGQIVENPQLVEGRSGKALLLNGEDGVKFPGLGEYSRTQPFSLSLWVRLTEPLENAVVVHRTRAALDAGSRGYELSLEEGRVVFGLTHMWPNNSIKIRSMRRLPRNEWVHLGATYDGSSRAGGMRIYWNGRPAEVETIRDNLFKDILYERVEVELTLGHRFRDRGFKGGEVDEFMIFNRRLTAIEMAERAGGLTVEEQLSAAAADRAVAGEQIFEWYLSRVDAAFREHAEVLRSLRVEQNSLIHPVPEIMVMQEMPEPRETFVLKRGAYDAPGERVGPGTPAAILPFAQDLPRNRLGLAQWLTDPQNPLTARVLVNRVWQMHFGQGLVETPGDLGSQGALPTHPRLLDWLATWFIDSGWDVKALHRKIVTSATYGQSSNPRPDLASRDPENRLLARGPRHRLPIEMIRDQALATGALLVRQIGGPSVKPYQPEGLWKEKSGARYERDQGAGLYRKSLYTFWKRTSPPPAMTTFDAAERNFCSVRRQTTSTPLQALVLLNDPQFVEAARKVAERMLKDGGTDLESRTGFAFRLLTSRAPSAAESDVLQALFREQRELFQKDPAAAAALLETGDAPGAESADSVELAAATVVIGALFGFDETIMKR